jgi:hypothetical protein
MATLRFVPHHQLKRHTHQPMLLYLRNKKRLFGAIKEVRKNGILFVASPMNKKSDVKSSLFVPIFLPFVIFLPFLIVI